MGFWTVLIGVVVASGVIYLALSINGVTEPPAGGDAESHGHH